jgi:enamine deaminase RidA (YjgF/YER057c/UK114 family)
MERKVVAPPSISRSEVHGYSQGILVEGGKKTLFISGQLAVNRNGEFVGGTFREQYRMALEGIEAVLKEAGATRRNVTKITTYVTDMKGNLEEFNKQNKDFFTEGYPTSTVVEVKGLAFPDQVVEIEAVAVI